MYGDRYLQARGWERVRLSESAGAVSRSCARFLKTQNIALLPNSVLLNARDEVEIVEEGGLARLRIPDSVKLWVVDGQHRLAGLRVAIEEEEDLRFKDYLIPVVVTVGLDEAKEAEQFRVINETAKKVRTDLARRILALLMSTREGRQQLRSQQRMWEAISSQVIDLLNTDENSPFHRRIQQPNEKKSARHTVRELSFSSSLKPILNTFPYQDWGSQKVADQLRDYWEAWCRAVPECFDNAEDYVLLLTPGIFSLHEVALFAWEVCRRENTEPTASKVGDMLSDIPEYGCLLLKLISVGLPASPKNGLHRGVRRTARSSAENPINFNRRQR